MSEKYIDKTIKKYLDDLAAKKPAPGGGSAGALAASIAAGLVSMAVNFSLGKGSPSSCTQGLGSPHEERLKEILKMSESLREKASRLIDEDIEVYQAFSAVFKLPKDSAGRKEKVQDALKDAARVPLEIAELGVEIIKLNKELFPICNARLISDIGVSLSLAYSSVEIGSINVEINLASIKDEQFNKNCKEKLESFKKISRQIKDEIYPEVEKKIIK